MEKYLFTDGTSGVREVQSKEELEQLIQVAPQKDSIKIWLFNTHEWISHSDFCKAKGSRLKKEMPSPAVKESPVRSFAGKRWLKKFLFFSFTGSAIFLVYNFTKIEWKKAPPLHVTAEHPLNVPPVNTDSLIQWIELTRGQKLDKTTRTNLRIRNGWPDRILLQLKADRDTSSIGTRYYDLELTIDNTTGYNIDNAVVRFAIWKNGLVTNSDTVRFSNISYALAASRKLNNTYRGDSISVSFQSIKARSFNFCYSADKKSNYGNNNDKWFCKE